MAENWLQIVQEVLKTPELLKEVYGDLAKPGVQQVGKALGTILGLGNTILWPIQLANERSRLHLENNLENYRKKLEQVPLEKIIPIPPEIGVPIAEKLSYVNNEKLADLYLSLLAKASSTDSISSAHPSFVNVINNLSPDEAQLLELFIEEDDLEFATARWDAPTKYSIAGDLLVTQQTTAKLYYPKNAAAYFSNLSGLGLVNIHYERQVHESDKYRAIEEYWGPQFPPESAPEPGRTLRFTHGVVSRTTFGKQFIEACHES